MVQFINLVNEIYQCKGQLQALLLLVVAVHILKFCLKQCTVSVAVYIILFRETCNYVEAWKMVTVSPVLDKQNGFFSAFSWYLYYWQFSLKFNELKIMPILELPTFQSLEVHFCKVTFLSCYLRKLFTLSLSMVLQTTMDHAVIIAMNNY